MSAEQHRQRAAGRSVACAVLTVSDTRTAETDASGDHIAMALEAAGHRVLAREIVRDDAGTIRAALLRLAESARVVIATGGTGIAGRDRTVRVAEALFTSEIPGFGELFRMLSYREIGAAAMLSRACAGLYGPDGRTVLFCCPGSTAAVRLAMDTLILPELAHVATEAERES